MLEVQIFNISFFATNSILLFVYFYLYFQKKEIELYYYSTLAYVVIVVILLGFRPIGKDGFPDTEMYSDWFLYAKNFHRLKIRNDIGYDLYNFILSFILNTRLFFVFNSILSVYLVFKIGKGINNQYFFFFIPVFFFTDPMFGFLSGMMRNSLAMLFFLIAIFQKKYFVKLLIFILAVTFHKSLLLPIIVFLIIELVHVTFKGKLIFALMLWLASIAISLFSSDFWLKLLLKLKIDKRLQYLTETNPLSGFFYKTTYRYDLVIVSLLIIVFITYILSRYNIRRKIYQNLFISFIIVNAFWISVMGANFNIRFFFLSWFMMPVLIGYPFLHASLKLHRLFIFLIGLHLISIIFFIKREVLKNNWASNTSVYKTACVLKKINLK